MSDFKSRKFVQTIAAEVGLLLYLFFRCPSEQVVYVIAAVVTVALGYNVANAWLGRAVAKNGKTPEA